MMNINIYNDISVNFRVKPKISKTNNKEYQLYIETVIYQKGIMIDIISISIGISLDRKDFSKGKAIGRGVKSNLINDRLNEHLNSTRNLLNELSLKKIKTCSELKNDVCRQNKVNYFLDSIS